MKFLGKKSCQFLNTVDSRHCEPPIYRSCRFYEPNFLSRQPEMPRYNELTALNTTESKLKIQNIEVQIAYKAIFERSKFEETQVEEYSIQGVIYFLVFKEFCKIYLQTSFILLKANFGKITSFTKRQMSYYAFIFLYTDSVFVFRIISFSFC